MDAKQLRIGNYVYRENSKLINQKDDVYQIENVNLQSALKYDPIPLTEEWLLKFGFYKISFSDYGHENLKGFIFGLSNTFEGITDIIARDLEINAIQYIHQLQNLYFALTEEELTIKN